MYIKVYISKGYKTGQNVKPQSFFLPPVKFYFLRYLSIHIFLLNLWIGTHLILFVYGKTVDSKASGLHVPTLSWFWGCIRHSKQCFYQRAYVWNKWLKIDVKSMDARASRSPYYIQHLLEPEAGPEGSIRKYQKCLFRRLVCWTNSSNFMV